MRRLYEDAINITRLYLGMGLALDGWRHIFEGWVLKKIPGAPSEFGETCQELGRRQVHLGCRMAQAKDPLI